jgi:hypothetical protein
MVGRVWDGRPEEAFASSLDPHYCNRESLRKAPSRLGRWQTEDLSRSSPTLLRTMLLPRPPQRLCGEPLCLPLLRTVEERILCTSGLPAAGEFPAGSLYPIVSSNRFALGQSSGYLRRPRARLGLESLL